MSLRSARFRRWPSCSWLPTMREPTMPDSTDLTEAEQRVRALADVYRTTYVIKARDLRAVRGLMQEYDRRGRAFEVAEEVARSATKAETDAINRWHDQFGALEA